MNEAEKRSEFLRVFKPIQSRLERFVIVLTRNRSDAEDVMSETILRSYESFESIRDSQALLAYMFSTATRLHRRRRARDERIEFSDADMSELCHSREADPETLADVNILMSALDAIPDYMREAFVLSELVGLQDKEIASIQGCSITNVRVRIFRTKQRLRKVLGVRSEVKKVTVSEPSISGAENDKH